MAMMSDVELPVAHVRAQVASAIDVVVHMARLRDGRRVVFQVATVDGLEDGEPVVTEMFAFRPRLGREGAFVATGVVPALARVLEGRGQSLAEEWFEAGPDEGAP
jgi:pilus assembly protein CpaF